MSGHSKWDNIKHRKGAQDAKRGNIFSKIAKEITIAAKSGGGDPASNIRLRAAIDKGRAVNLPKDKIEKAIKRGTGEIEGVSYEELLYEGYGVDGVAIIVEITTDNRNRTAAEIRKIFSKHNGNLGEGGSVAWMFERKGVVVLDATKYSEDEVLECALDLGAEDVVADDETIVVYAPMEDYIKVVDGLKDKGYEVMSSSLSYVPKNKIDVVEPKRASSIMKLIDALEEHDDVNEVYNNANMSDEVLESL